MRVKTFIELMVVFSVFNLCSGLSDENQNICRGMIKIFIGIGSLDDVPDHSGGDTSYT